MPDLTSLAVFMHVVGWKSDAAEVAIGPGIYLRKSEGSAAHRLYTRLCETAGLDDGEPFVYPAFILLTSGTRAYSPISAPYNDLTRLLDVVSLVLESPVLSCRLIYSTDGFSTVAHTSELDHWGMQNELLQHNSRQGDLTDGALTSIQQIWQVVSGLGGSAVSNQRLLHALVYFGHAWREPVIYRTCVDLAIVLEVLFAPESTTEVTHQIAYNVAWFSGSSPADREERYRQTKRFYSIRSKLVHGGVPDDDQLVDPTVEMFHLVCQILRRILSDPGTAQAFNNEEYRRRLLRDLSFAHPSSSGVG